MHVWIVTTGEPLPTDPGDPRLMRSGALAIYLADRGHSVTWFNSTFDHLHKRQRADHNVSMHFEGVRIELLKSTGYRRNISLARFIAHASVARAFARRARQLSKPDVILCSLPTLELCAEAVAFQKREGIPVLLDVRDPWPDVYYRVVPEAFRSLLRIVLRWQERMASLALRNASGIIGISPGYLDWGLARADRSQSDLDAMLPLGCHVGELPDDETEKARNRLFSLGITNHRTIVWYVGTMGFSYDLAPVIKAARKFEMRSDSPLFVISGTGDFESRWKKQAEGLSNMVFTGWISRSEIRWLRQNASIGLQAYAFGALQGFSIKTSEYLSAGLPIVSSLAGENAEFLRSSGAGIVYEVNNPESCYQAIDRLISDRKLLEEMAANAKRAFDDYFSIDATFGGLERLLDKAAAAGIRGNT